MCLMVGPSALELTPSSWLFPDLLPLRVLGPSKAANWYRLIIGIGAQLGVRAAAASGEDANQCVALETTRVRQRVANEIWSNYHDYVCARIKFADPTPDKQRTNQDEAAGDAAFQTQQAQRYTIQAYLHRTRQPLELGV